MNRVTRHTLYYRLMDFSLVGNLLSFSVAIAIAATGRDVVPALIQPIFTFVGVASLIIPALLIFQRWMRDDFSEMLWQRTAGTVLKLLIILPIPLAIGWGMWIAEGNSDLAQPRMNIGNPSDPVVSAVVQGMVQSLVYLWVATPILFTFAFQWHRWRASR